MSSKPIELKGVADKSPRDLSEIGANNDDTIKVGPYQTLRKKNFDANSYTIQKGVKGWGGLEAKVKELDRLGQDIEKNEEGEVPLAVVQQEAKESSKTQKFGTWDGVFVSCLLNIFGVIMFLRLPWVVGQAGIILTLVIIILSNIVTTITALSMSAICTNGEVRAGGAYYLISRSLGHRVGGPIGILFSLGQAVAVALYVIGFCETVILLAGPALTGDELNDIRIVGLCLVTVLLVMAYIGTGWVINLQIGLLGLLCGSIISVMLGIFVTPPNESKDFVGLNSSAFMDNLMPEFRDGYDFFQVFAVFFPAVTGIMAGANISGDLKDPSENIPEGTLWAIAVSTVVYMLMAVGIGAVVARGDEGSDNGLYMDPLVMVIVAVPYIGGPLVLAGIFAATFSSGLASLVGAPRILMSVAQDDLIPAIKPFAKVRESDQSPIRGYFLTYIVSSCCILIGSLNAIAPLISMFFMITYGLINISTFTLEISKSISWRPNFVYFNKWASFFGFILCIAIMFLTSWYIALAAIAIAVGLYYYIDYRDPPINWGSANQARHFYDVEKAMMRMRFYNTHIKTFRPHYLVMSGDPADRLALAQFVASLRKGYGITVFGNVVQGDYESTVKQYRHQKYDYGYYEDTSVPHLKVRGFMNTVIAPNLRSGLQSLLCTGGLGALRPNTLVMGFKEDWKERLIEDKKEDSKAKLDDTGASVKEYIAMCRDGFKMGMGVMICRNMNKVDWSLISEGKGTVDVYWLVDDGGLTLLVPYIMSLHRWWKQTTDGKKTPIRLLLVGDLASCNVVRALVEKFRIPCEVSQCSLDTNTTEALENYKTFSKAESVNKESKGKNEHWMKVGEAIRQESKDARMVFVTLPYPLNGIDQGLYMSWLDALSIDKPTVLIRGNNDNVLTFYLE
mmetsp:Transcript_17137/g.30707  ORF Transcript_17137/g.30707 Transcript_17137/m.30707 type:complete len:903 (-) Transcript_17137:328-3036(-)|eukprot:CAMPEP_0197536530 /NCGR_PEP_ID=MMETSP1318-20131121/54120_1 /TAXON_ID=552666 /ORGANISM="Partenskyella glossopodia, Strain RCC365" /LENGTH=902 /DNA_ID=CAMNT_0043094445 /DNA_START=98 /DNA_END=2806 /DNA_ORIENTATION=-